MTLSSIKGHCAQLVEFTADELALIDDYFQPLILKKNELLLRAGKVCDFVVFINKGSLRYYFVKGIEEKTFDIIFENTFFTDYPSFNDDVPSQAYVQALEKTELLVIRKSKLHELYKVCPKYEAMALKISERVAAGYMQFSQAMATQSPEERYQMAMELRPELFQRVSLKYIAEALGMSPETLSGVRNKFKVT